MTTTINTRGGKWLNNITRDNLFEKEGVSNE